tara:strand:- start:64 stop:597 length:534 start_codon:yes stop_codon:yes gene_type:complete
MKMFIAFIFLLPTVLFGLEVDLSKSNFKWTGAKVTGSHFGKVSLKSAKLDVKDGHINSGEFVMDMTSMTCEDLTGDTMNKLLNHLKNDDFFSVNKHPTATLKIKHGMMGKLDGELTIKGITKPISLKYSKKNNVFKGQMKFDRTHYGIKYGSGSFFKGLGDRIIYDEVTVDFVVTTK